MLPRFAEMQKAAGGVQQKFKCCGEVLLFALAMR
jgi:hypothetical protein